MPALPTCLPPIPSITVVDVGAMMIGEGKEPYAKLIAELSCRVVGFEPQAHECARLNARQQPSHTYLPYFIGDGQRHTFRECNFPATSSLFAPNVELLSRFNNLAELTQVVRQTEVDTVRLDDLPECRGADLLKVDVQGGELLVFRGATKLLESVVVLQTEVEFAPLYLGQPLFADIDAMLRAHGFVFHRFNSLQGRTMKPFVVNNNPNATLSQTLWGDAVYVKDFMRLAQLDPEQLLKMVAILHINYHAFDLAAHALGHFDQISGTSFFPAYVHAMTNR